MFLSILTGSGDQFKGHGSRWRGESGRTRSGARSIRGVGVKRMEDGQGGAEERESYVSEG